MTDSKATTPSIEPVKRDYSVFDAFADGVQVIDFGYHYLYLNDAVVTQSQSTREELLGATMMEKYPGIEHTKLFETIRRCIESRCPTYTTNDFTFPDGTRQYFQLRIEPLPEGAVIFSTDVTESQAHLILMENMGSELERIVERRTEELAAKNRELEQITSVAAHDLKSPVRTISNLMQILQDDYGNTIDEEATELIRQAISSAKRMYALVDGIVEHASIGRSPQLSQIDANEIVQQVCRDLYASIAEKNATVLYADLPSFFAYPTEFRLLIQNLVANAIKYSHPDVPPKIKIRAHRDEEKIHFQIQDNGIGIPERDRTRIFNIFQRLHPPGRYDGAGIGLAHCEKIVGLHGGKIWVEPAPQGGSIFHFTVHPSLAAPEPIVSSSRLSFARQKDVQNRVPDPSKNRATG